MFKLKRYIRLFFVILHNFAVNLRVLFYKCIFYLFKVDNRKIVFVNEDYSCNPKAIAEKMISRDINCNLVWLSDFMTNDIPSKISLYKKSGIWGAYHLSTAKIIVMNSKGDKIRYFKKQCQYLIQTLHGSFPLKYVEAECVEKLPSTYVKNSMIDSQMTDVMLSDSAWTSTFCRNSFWYNGEVMESGYPRNDVYFNYNEDLKRQIKKELHIQPNKKIVTYAPTFRDNGDFCCYNLDAIRLLEELRTKTGDDWILLVRAHPNIYYLSGKSLEFDYSDKIRDVTTYPDAQKLFLVTDLLITDYSSIMIDFMLLHKPVLLFATDEKEYASNRGIRPEYWKLPFPHAKNNDELISYLRNLDMDNPYTDEFMKWYGSKDDGHASERVVERIQKILSIS